MNNEKYMAMGLAALIPGMQFLIDRMQIELDGMRRQLAQLQNGVAPKQGRPPGPVKKAIQIPREPAAKKRKSNWPADPEERKREMKRRQAKWKKKPSHPRDANHPDHAQWLANMRRTSRRFWKSLTPAQQTARMKHAAAGRVAKLVNGAAA